MNRRIRKAVAAAGGRSGSSSPLESDRSPAATKHSLTQRTRRLTWGRAKKMPPLHCNSPRCSQAATKPAMPSPSALFVPQRSCQRFFYRRGTKSSETGKRRVPPRRRFAGLVPFGCGFATLRSFANAFASSAFEFPLRFGLGLHCVTLLAFFTSLAVAATSDAVFVIPLKPDPPPAVDGQLTEWVNRPGALELNRREQATWGGSAWTSPADLSARVWLAWRADTLYLAASVTDDQLRQSQRGEGLWRGDHMMLFLDVAPDDEPQRNGFGHGQFQIAFSPGNFSRTGDALTSANCGWPRVGRRWSLRSGGTDLVRVCGIISRVTVPQREHERLGLPGSISSLEGSQRAILRREHKRFANRRSNPLAARADLEVPAGNSHVGGASAELESLERHL